MVETAAIASLLLALFLVFMNGFFVAAEFALVKIRPNRVDALVEEGRRSAKQVKDATENLDGYLAVSQLGITISSLGLGWIGEPAVAALLDPVLTSVLPAGSIHAVSVAIGFGIVTFLHVVFGELAPKTLSIQDAERISLAVAPFMKVFYYLFLPGIVVFNGTANFFTALVGFPPASESEETHTEEDIRMILTRSGEQGQVDLEEVDMIESVFDLEDTVAREVMVPRPDVEFVLSETALPELRSVAAEGSHTRYLVIDQEGEESAVGFVHVKDVLRATESIDEQRDALTARDLAREVVVVPENRPIDELLSELRERNSQMAVIIDEWGALEGIVTVEDIVEEIVGEIRDEFDAEEPEPAIEEVGDGAYAIDGRVPIGEANDVLEAAFESEDFETVGGLVLGHLGRAPEVEDRIELNGYSLQVKAVEGTRIAEARAREQDRREVEPEGAGKPEEPGEPGEASDEPTE
jgi:CBS domain containing-hemolysin-like protein